MKKLFNHLQFLTLGVFLLGSTAIYAASNECFSSNELNDFKTLYIKLQNELNYENKDAFLDKKFQVRLKPHGKDKTYPGREFESALFSEYQNSLRKIGKLYQSAKFENDDNFKSNELLVNFMKAIDDKSSESQEFINKTKIKDVINALEEASQKKYAKSNDKKFMINAGDKYLLEKLLIHAQDRVCSVSKFEETNQGTALFKADYLKQIKNAPLNILVNVIKNAPIGKDSKIELNESSDLTASLIDPNIAVESAVADNLNQLSAWIKKVKEKGPKCLAAIKSKDFANKIQANIQGCNFGHFIETLGQNNVNNLESVLHFINANEKLMNNPAAKAETGLDELKLEGFLSKTFENLGTAVRCTQLDAANSGDKKVFIRNLPYNENSNKFDTSGIICKSYSKALSADACKKQYDLISDNLGRGLEIKPKKSTVENVTFSVKDSDNCSDIPFLNPATPSVATSPEQCTAQLKDGAAFVWDTKNNKCNEVEIAKVTTIEQCVALKKEGSVFNWDLQKKSCNEFSALLTDAVLKQTAQQCIVQKKNGYSFKWDSSKNSCDETPILAGTQLESKIACDAKTSANLPFKWNSNDNICEKSPVLTATELKAKETCEARSKSGFSNAWNTQKSSCDQVEIAKVSTIHQCVALKKPGSVFNWDAQKNSCNEFSSLLLSAALKQSAQQCEVQKKTGSSFKWDSVKNECAESSTSGLTSAAIKENGQNPLSIKDVKSKESCEAVNKNGFSHNWDSQKSLCSAVEIAKVSTIEQCVALRKEGSVFNWDAQKSSCNEFSSLLSNAALKQSAQQCIEKKKAGYIYKWNSANSTCAEIPTVTGTKLETKIACDAKISAGLPFKWNSSEYTCEKNGNTSDSDSRSPADLKNPGLNKYESQVRNRNTKDDDSKNGDSKNTDLQNGNSRSSMLTDSKNGIVTSERATTPSIPSDVNEKQAKLACESKSSPGNSFRWNSVNKNCEGSTITSNSNNAGKTPIVKPIILTNEDTKPVIKNPNPPVVGSKDSDIANEESKTKLTTPPVIKADNGNNGLPLSNLPKKDTNSEKVNCEVQTKEGFVYKWMEDSKKCVEQDTLVAKTKCEDQKKEGFAYEWLQDSLKCVETEVTKAQLDCETNKKEGFEYKWMPDSVKCAEIDLNAKVTCEAKKKDGFTFSWDSVKEICNEVPAITKLDEEDTTLADAENKCIADNAEWIDNENEGRPGIKYEWDGKACIDKRPDKDGKKKAVNQAPQAQEAPSAPKRAPARFTPINIPSRQIYLMPGMP